MTWNRVIQLTAELQVLTNLDQQGTNGPSISSTQVHTGTRSYLLVAGGSLWGYAVPSPLSRVRLSYFFRHNGFVTNVTAGYLFVAATGKTQFESAMIGIRIDTVGNTLQVVRPVSGTTNSFDILASVAIPASLSATGAWLHISVYYFGDSTDGVLKLNVNGITVLDYSGDTRMYGQGSGVDFYATAPSFVWLPGGYQGTGNNFTTSAFVDDIYLDNSSDEAYGLIPARTFDIRTVSASGHDAAWTPTAGSNFQCVDEVPNNGDTDYVKALSAGLKDTYNFTDLTIASDHRIVAEIPTLVIKNLDVGPLVRLHAYDGSTFESSADLTPALDYSIPLWARFELQPDGTAWNEADGNSMQWGMESRGTF